MVEWGLGWTCPSTRRTWAAPAMPGPESRRPAAPTTRGDRSREAGCAKTSIEEKRFPVYERLFKGTNFPFDYLNRIKYTNNAVLCTSPSHSQISAKTTFINVPSKIYIFYSTKLKFCLWYHLTKMRPIVNLSFRGWGGGKQLRIFFFLNSIFFIILDKKSTYLFDDSGNYNNICIGSNVKNMPLSLQDFTIKTLAYVHSILTFSDLRNKLAPRWITCYRPPLLRTSI